MGSIMKGLLRYLENSNTNLVKAISKTKDENLKKELEKRLRHNRKMVGISYYP